MSATETNNTFKYNQNIINLDNVAFIFNMDVAFRLSFTRTSGDT